MSKAVSFGLLLTCFLLIACVCAKDNGHRRCNCEDESSMWTIGKVLECQRVSDIMIAVAYLSIPIEIIYFLCRSNFRFKWVIFLFIFFIALCGATHLLTGMSSGPHSFEFMLTITVFKIFTALVSCATSLAFLTLIPLLLKVKIREFMLKKKTSELGREVGFIMQQTEASKHVRMITQEIRKSLDRHNILYTTLLELSKTLGLKTCAVWMPNDEKPEMNLTHELNGRNVNCSIPITNPDVVRIKESDEVNIIDSDSVLVTASSGDSGSAGPVAAIRMPMLRVSNFSGGTPEIRETCYAILVLILPVTEHKSWSAQELEIIKGVADQVAVALSHAAILEESLLTRVKLEEQNRALQVEKMNTMRANQAREAFQKIMSNGMGKPMHSILGLLSVMKEDKLKSEQKLIVDSLLRTSSVLSNLLNDAMDSARDDGRFPLEMKPFGLHALVRETACLARFMCVYRCLGFVVDADKSLPDNVIGDEKRVSQVLMHMIGSAINGNQGGGTLVFRVYAEGGSLGRNDQGCSNWTPSSSSGDVNIRFEIGMKNGASELENSVPTGKPPGSVRARDRVEERLSFSICKRIIQSMQGNIWFVPNAEDHPRVIHLSLRFQLQRSMAVSISETGEIYEPSSSEPSFRGLQVLLVENDNVNRAVTQWLLQKLGCIVTSVSSGYECLSAIQLGGCSFQVIILELHMPELDGFEVASRIRKFGSQNWPVIIALTASTGDFSEKCKQVGMNGVIRKPVLLQGLASELRRIMSTVL